MMATSGGATHFCPVIPTHSIHVIVRSSPILTMDAPGSALGIGNAPEEAGPHPFHRI